MQLLMKWLLFEDLYLLTINQRLPFLDNTLDLLHTDRLIGFVLLDFILCGWGRVPSPGGLLWIDSLFCLKEDLDDYLEAFKMPRNGKHRRIAVPKLNKNGRQVFFSAVPEKPPRPIRYQHMPKPIFLLVSDSGSPISLASTLSPC